MKTNKQTDSASAKPITTTPASRPAEGRKPWKKRSVGERMLAQLDQLREEVARKEEEYTKAKKQLDQLEGLRKVLESS